MLRPAAFPLCLTLLLAAASAGAAPRPARIGVRLQYQRGPLAQKCPAETELRGGVAAGLGHDPFTETGLSASRRSPRATRPAPCFSTLAKP